METPKLRPVEAIKGHLETAIRVLKHSIDVLGKRLEEDKRALRALTSTLETLDGSKGRRPGLPIQPQVLEEAIQKTANPARFTTQEIATLLGCSPNTARSQLHRLVKAGTVIVDPREQGVRPVLYTWLGRSPSNTST